MVTLYLEVDDSNESLPGVEQKMSVGRIEVMLWWLFSLLLESRRPEVDLMTGEKRPTSSSIWDSCAKERECVGDGGVQWVNGGTLGGWFYNGGNHFN